MIKLSLIYQSRSSPQKVQILGEYHIFVSTIEILDITRNPIIKSLILRHKNAHTYSTYIVTMCHIHGNILFPKAFSSAGEGA